MNERFTVQFFKRLITIVVLLTIIGLITMLVVFKAQIGNLSKTLKENTNAYANEYISMATLSYQKKYSDMYVERKAETANDSSSKIVYLTFDDGPSKVNTTKILDILEENDINATFFVIHNGEEYADDLIKRSIEDGNTIGIHTYTHDYEKIYKSVDSYLADFNKMYRYLKEECNYEATIFRFPGGSVNAYNLNVYDRIIPEMYRRGFVFYDWDASAQDAVVGHVSAKEIENTVVKQVSGSNRSVVLMHDSADKDSTVAALPGIIKRLKKQGYTFKALDNTVTPISFANE